MKVENLSTLKIHRLTQSQYNKALLEGRLEENALYLTPEETTADGFATEEFVLNTVKNLVHESQLNDAVQEALNEAKAEGAFDGRGIESINLNDDYTLTFIYTDNTTYTTKSIQGPQGIPGPEGKQGAAGKNGISITHTWDGTTLNITSASGTSGSNLKGDTGKTAFEYAKEQGYIGSESDFAIKMATPIPTIDTTLLVANAAADAKIVGEKLIEIANNRGTFYVLITEDSFTPSFSEIQTAIENNYNIIAIYEPMNNLRIPLTLTLDGSLLFHLVIFDQQVKGLFISINSNETVNTTIEEIAMATVNSIGLVKPSITWTDTMKTPIGMDETGALWFETDKTLSLNNRAADAAAVKAELVRLETLISNIATPIDFTIVDDGFNNIEITKMPYWKAEKATTNDTILTSEYDYWVVSDNNLGDVEISSPKYKGGYN